MAYLSQDIWDMSYLNTKCTKWVTSKVSSAINVEAQNMTYTVCVSGAQLWDQVHSENHLDHMIQYLNEENSCSHISRHHYLSNGIKINSIIGRNNENGYVIGHHS